MPSSGLMASVGSFKRGVLTVNPNDPFGTLKAERKQQRHKEGGGASAFASPYHWPDALPYPCHRD